MSKSSKKPPASTPAKSKAKPAKDATEKARKAAAAEIAARIEAMPDTDTPPPAPASLHDDTVVRGDGEVVQVSVPTDEPKAPAATKHAPASTPARKRSVGPGGKRIPKPKPAKVKKVSGLDAAAMVLAASKEPMKATDMLAEIQRRGLWTSKGKTPEATLYAAIIREIAAKGKEARFKKHDRGLFVAGKKAD